MPGSLECQGSSSEIREVARKNLLEGRGQNNASVQIVLVLILTNKKVKTSSLEDP